MWTGSQLKYLSRDATTGDLKIAKTCSAKGIRIRMNSMHVDPTGLTCYVAEGLNKSKSGKGGDLHVFSLVGK
jgi:hypothetical protein